MRKGQAAMEFLMTYGWAILVVLAAIGALAYFGILSPSKLLPNSYTMSGGISAGEYKVATDGTVSLGLINNQGVQINITKVDVNTTGGSAVTCNAGNSTTTILDNGGSATYVLTCSAATEGTKFKGDVKVRWRKTTETVVHTASGALSVSVEQ